MPTLDQNCLVVVDVRICFMYCSCFVEIKNNNFISEKIGSLVGSGGKFYLQKPKEQKPVGEFEVTKSLGTISGLRCSEFEQPPATRMQCSGLLSILRLNSMNFSDFDSRVFSEWIFEHRKIPGITPIMIFPKKVDFEQIMPRIRNLKILRIQPNFTNLTVS